MTEQNTKNDLYKVEVYFDNKRGIRVTNFLFKARHNDIKPEFIMEKKIGRNHYYISLAIGFGLVLMCAAFDPWLKGSEQMGILAIGAIIIAANYSVAPLIISTPFKERALVLWSDFWTIQKVCDAIDNADIHNNLKDAQRVKWKHGLPTHDWRG